MADVKENGHVPYTNDPSGANDSASNGKADHLTPHTFSPPRYIRGKPRRRKAPRTAVARLCALVVSYQITVSATLVAILLILHNSFPPARHYTRKFLQLSYHQPQFDTYGQGWDDIFLVSCWIVIFTGLRAAMMDHVFKPFAQRAGIRTLKGRVRFAEQAWLFVYPSISWSAGMYIMYHSEYWLNLKGLWIDWPIREIHRLEKWYYLVQYAFWIQQILVVNIEERRKDYHQMLAHHFITCALMFASYGYHMTRVGIAILCVMDVVDILLPLAKMLNYVHLKMACDIVFGVFLVTWFLARHVVYLLIMWSIYADLPVFIPPGCYSGPTGHIKGPFPAPDTFMHVVRPFMEPEGTVCFTKGIQWGFLTMLGALQIITCIWFVMIVKVAWKVIKGTGAEDTRSEDEDELDDQEEMEAEDADETGEFGDITVGKGLRPEVMFNGSARRKPARKGSNDPGGGGGVITDEDNTTSGIRLPGHSDRKELLRRIGCNNKI